MIHRIRAIDAHTEGEPLRLVTDGLPSVEGATMLEKRAWAAMHIDHLRRALMWEPRGHRDMYGALLTEPVSPGAHAGVLFMHHEGWSTMCGHGIIAVATIALERQLLWAAGLEVLALDTPAGLVRAHAGLDEKTRRVRSVTFDNVPSFVLAAGVPVPLAGRTVPVDVAFGGAFYAIVDAEAAGIRLEPERASDLRALGLRVRAEVERLVAPVHPEDHGLRGIYGVIFTSPPHHAEAHLRNLTVFADGAIDRSPCGTGTAAVMAVLDEMGLLGGDAPFVHESVIGTRFRGRVVGRKRVGELGAIVPAIEGSAWIVAEQEFLLDGDDPLVSGFTL